MRKCGRNYVRGYAAAQNTVNGRQDTPGHGATLTGVIDASEDADDGPKSHRTIDRVTQILEEVVHQPGISFAELTRALDAPKSSVHGFIRGLQAKGWLYENNRQFYLGPAIYGLTLAGGHIPAGQVTQADLDALHKETGTQHPAHAHFDGRR